MVSKRSCTYVSGSDLTMLSSCRTISFSSSVSFSLMSGLETMSATHSMATLAVSFRIMP